MPTVTVLLCVYNDAPFIGAAVRSILAQTFGDFELLAIDDASTDGSGEIVSGFGDPRVRVLRNESNLGLTRSLNIGLAAARGELIARQDSDDVSLPERLQKQVAAFRAIPDLALLGSQAKGIDQHGKTIDASGWRKCTTALGIEWQLMFENAFVHTSAMFRRDVIRDLGGYDERWPTNQDFELWSRVVARHRAGNLDEPLVLLRGRAGSLSKGYSLDALRRVGDKVLENRSRSLQRPCEWDEGLSILISAWNPALCAPVRDVGPLIGSLHELLARFTELHPEVAHSSEIRTHAGSIFSRVANLLASRTPVAALRSLAAMRSFDRGGVLRNVPRVVARIGYGLLRPGRRPRGNTVLSIPVRDQRP